MTDCRTKEINRIVLLAVSAIEKNEIRDKLNILNTIIQMLNSNLLEFYQIFKLNIALDLMIENLESVSDLYQKNNFSSEEISSLEKRLFEAKKVAWPTPRLVDKRM